MNKEVLIKASKEITTPVDFESIILSDEIIEYDV